MPSNIFISYSHVDSALVVPVVGLLRASKALVFRDADSIRPGKRWSQEIITAISEASVVVVFWCQHAKNSQEVEKEFLAAITQGKDVLPLLLDETPLPSNLAAFQYIDFRAAFGKGHGIMPSPAQPAPAPAARSSWKLWGFGLVVAVLVAAIGSFLLLKAPLPTFNPEITVPAGRSTIGLWLSAVTAGLILLVAFLIGLRARKRQMTRREADWDAPITPGRATHVLLAKTIEAELARRTGASAF